MSTWDKTNNSFGHSLTALDTTKKKSGSYSGRIDDNYPANWEKYVYSDTWTPINNSQDTYYTVSGWIYVENVANNDAQIWLSTRKSGETGYPSGNYSSKTTQRSRWEYLSKTVLVPADVRELNIRIDNNKKGKVWFDDVKIVKGNASQTVIVEESNYYPFGGLHKGYNNVVSANGNAVAQKFGYNGKEYQEDLGYNMHDFDMRHYDPWTARWVTVDPKAEEMRRHSPYNYAFNNPVIFIDKNGDGPILGILGALAGAVVETVSQVAGAVATGSSFSEAVSNIDYADVGIAAVEYGVAGLTNGASLLVSGKIADVAQASIDVSGDGQVTSIFGSNNGQDAKSLKQAAVEVVVGKTVGAAANKIGKVANNALNKTIKKQTSNLTAKSKNLTKSNNARANGNTRSKAKSANASFKEFSVAKDKVLTTKQVKQAVNSKAGGKTVDVAKAVTSSVVKDKIKIKKDQE